MEDVLKVSDPNNAALTKVVLQIPISRHTAERRINAINASLEDFLNNGRYQQMAVFIRFVSPDFVVKEELLDFVALQESMGGVYINIALDAPMKTFDVPLNKLINIAVDGAPVMLYKKSVLKGF